MSCRVKAVQRLLARDGQNRVPCTPATKMVKRMRVTAETVSLRAPLTAKTEQAWRYSGGVIKRHESLIINNRTYYDDKDPDKKLPRRKHESNFFITINTNRSVSGGAAAFRSVAELALKQTLLKLSQDHMIAQYLKFGPKSDVYKNDRYVDVIERIEWQDGIETGDVMNRLHCHIWMTIHHYSQVQINSPVLGHMFKVLYNEELRTNPAAAQQVGVSARPYVNVKLLPQSDFTDIMKQYIHKGATA